MKSEVKGKMNMNNMYVELIKIEKVLRKHRKKNTRKALLLISCNFTLVQYLKMVMWQ